MGGRLGGGCRVTIIHANDKSLCTQTKLTKLQREGKNEKVIYYNIILLIQYSNCIALFIACMSPPIDKKFLRVTVP